VGTGRLVAAAFALWALAFVGSVRVLPRVAAAAQPPAAPAAGAGQAPTDADCFACHEDDSAARENGTPVVVKPAVLKASSHADIACVDCHADLGTTTDFPHPEKLNPVECSTCHSDEAALFDVSAHARARALGSGVAAGCVDCHGSHDVKPKSDPESRTHHLTIADTCGRCHGNPETVARGGMRPGVVEAFADSLHGRLLERSGLVVAPTCSSCHGAHDIRESRDPESRIAAPRIAGTCGTCHQGVARQFHGGVHAAVLKTGKADAPACQTCHTAHAIGRTGDEAWQLSVINQCGTCHVDRVRTFRDTFHGQVTVLGSRTVAGCADCHGAHEVLPASDPRSPIAPANLVTTCGTCHPRATPGFVQYDPHGDKDDRRRNPALYYTSRLMTGLLAGVFGFFGLHTLLWFGKEIRVKRQRARLDSGGRA
jgi:hypothetical protein